MHPYLVGESEGRAVIDSVRAAANVEKSGAGKRFAVWGHSQGGHAALFAGQLAASYAPELALSGVAAIAPATELSELLRDDLSTVAAGPRVLQPLDLVPLLRRLDRDGREPSPSASSTRSRATASRRATRSTASGSTRSRCPAAFLVEGAIDRDPWKSLLERNRPGRLADPGAGLRRAGRQDVVVRPSVTADYVAGLCRQGRDVRFERLAGVGHMRAGARLARRARSVAAIAASTE